MASLAAHAHLILLGRYFVRQQPEKGFPAYLVSGILVAYIYFMFDILRGVGDRLDTGTDTVWAMPT